MGENREALELQLNRPLLSALDLLPQQERLVTMDAKEGKNFLEKDKLPWDINELEKLVLLSQDELNKLGIDINILKLHLASLYIDSPTSKEKALNLIKQILPEADSFFGRIKLQYYITVCGTASDAESFADNFSKIAPHINSPNREQIIFSAITLLYRMCIVSNDPNGRLDKIFAHLKEAIKNIPCIEYSMARCWESGIGLNCDHKEATKLYQLAANQGYLPAIYRIAGYDCKEKHPYDNKVFFSDKLVLAAEQKYAPAQQALAFCYNEGNDVKLDEDKAIEYYSRATKQIGANYNSLEIGINPFFSLASIYQKRKEYLKALIAYRNAYFTTPKNCPFDFYSDFNKFASLFHYNSRCFHQHKKDCLAKIEELQKIHLPNKEDDFSMRFYSAFVSQSPEDTLAELFKSNKELFTKLAIEDLSNPNHETTFCTVNIYIKFLNQLKKEKFPEIDRIRAYIAEILFMNGDEKMYNYTLNISPQNLSAEENLKLAQIIFSELLNSAIKLQNQSESWHCLNKKDLKYYKRKVFTNILHHLEASIQKLEKVKDPQNFLQQIQNFLMAEKVVASADLLQLKNKIIALQDICKKKLLEISDPKLKEKIQRQIELIHKIDASRNKVREFKLNLDKIPDEDEIIKLFDMFSPEEIENYGRCPKASGEDLPLFPEKLRPIFIRAFSSNAKEHLGGSQPFEDGELLDHRIFVRSVPEAAAANLASLT